MGFSLKEEEDPILFHDDEGDEPAAAAHVEPLFGVEAEEEDPKEDEHEGDPVWGRT